MGRTKTFASSWSVQLRSLLSLRVNEAAEGSKSTALRIAVLGIGNEFNGDDAAGVLVVRALRKIIGQADHLLLIEGGTAPENTTATLRRFHPDVVLMIDSAEMGEEPGCVHLLAVEALDGLSASTHTLPPSVLATFLQRELGCRVLLLGIQPQTLEFDAPLSEPVRRAISQIKRGLRQILSYAP